MITNEEKRIEMFKKILLGIDSDVENIEVRANEAGKGVYEENKSRHFGKNTIEEYVRCSNPSCQRGGFCVGEEIRDMVRKGETERKKMLICRGDEGSPKGKRPGRRCPNHIDAEIKIKYKDVPQTTDQAHLNERP